MSTLTQQQVLSAARIGCALLEAVEQAGELGAPEGVCYAAFMAHGMSLSQFQSLTASLIRRGFITCEDHLLTITQAGRTFRAETEATIAKIEAAQGKPANSQVQP